MRKARSAMTGFGRFLAGRRIVQGALIAAMALTLFVGFHPGGAKAYRSESLTCTTLEAGFNAAGDAYGAAARRGDKASANFYAKLSGALQDAWLGLDCGDGSPNEAV